MSEHINFIILPTVFISVYIMLRALHTVRPDTKNRRIQDMSSIVWQTGDIVLIHNAPIVTSFTDSIWSHIGIVLQDKKGDFLLYEITPSSFFPTLRPLKTALTSILWDGRRVVGMRRISPALSAKKIYNIIKKYKKNKVHYEHIWWRTIFLRAFGFMLPISPVEESVVKRNGHICSTLIASVLKDLGVLHPSLNPYKIIPDDFDDLSSHVPLCNFKYKIDPVVFLRIVRSRKNILL